MLGINRPVPTFANVHSLEKSERQSRSAIGEALGLFIHQRHAGSEAIHVGGQLGCSPRTVLALTV